ncbi:MAG: hypothetical protein CMO82_12785 [Winogradskyella sp.]|nr:hypothetical protein [Winogradskyella sp.]|tara:strand:- start:1478 stop:2110 length:633 start_codon:yes stop_codon:yes gene_type:complete
MNIKLSIFIIITNLVLLSCRDSILKTETTKVSIDAVTPKDSKALLEELLTQIDSIENKESTNQQENEDCIFDQSTQTDEFLKDIKELEGYVWHPDTKMAEIILNKQESLIIKRGGCDVFQFYASFMNEKVLDFEKDKKQIFDSIIWITSLLEDFDGEDIKRVIEEGKISITKRDEFNYHANFMDKKLYEQYYFNFNNKDITTFEIGYYYD